VETTLQDDTKILNSVQDQHQINPVRTGISDMAIARRYDLELRPPAADDHNYHDVSNTIELSVYKEAAIPYISGYVVKIVEKKVNCPQCLAVLTMSKESILDSFITWKTNGRPETAITRTHQNMKGVMCEVCNENATCKWRWFTS
jgi:hypothetical protein